MKKKDLHLKIDRVFIGFDLQNDEKLRELLNLLKNLGYKWGDNDPINIEEGLEFLKLRNAKYIEIDGSTIYYGTHFLDKDMKSMKWLCKKVDKILGLR